MYTIKEISKKFELAASTLRYYEEIGILPNVLRTGSNKRVYTEECVGRLEAIGCFKRAGMTLPQIKKFFEYEEDKCKNIDSMLSLLDHQKDNIALQLKQLKSDYEHIQMKLRYYEAMKNSIIKEEQYISWDEFLNL